MTLEKQSHGKRTTWTYYPGTAEHISAIAGNEVVFAGCPAHDITKY
jgi:hypothetical protein